MIKELKNELLNYADKKYKSFSTSLIPGVNNVIGVRLPLLRKIAKDIAKSNFEEFTKQNDDEFMELTLIEGMATGYFNTNPDEKFNLIKNFIPKINNWSVCDSFCMTLKFINKNKKETKKFLEPYFKSKKEFELRFAYVVLLCYFIESDYDYVIKKIAEFNNDAYYGKMAAAWALSICLVKNYDVCLNDLKSKKFHPFVYKKGITKAIESLRLNKEQKERLKALRNLKKSHLS